MSSELREWLQFGLWIAVGLYSWLANRERASRAQVDTLRRELDRAESRVAVIEERVKHLPSSEEFGQISADLRVLVQRLDSEREKDTLVRSSFDQQFALMRAQYDRIDLFLRGKFG